MLNKVAVIGAGISGLAVAQRLKEEGFDVTVFEKKAVPGGLINCTLEDGNLFHRVGGHVFNTKITKVDKWFWGRFDKEKEFFSAKRNAKILLDGAYINYPIENNLYQLNPETVAKIIDELFDNTRLIEVATNLYSFLENKFGKTLFNLYFKPYNSKIWNCDLKKIPLEWLVGKLPMPNFKDILINNILKKDESLMVHSTFYYPKINGSSFIADRLCEGLKIKFNCAIEKVKIVNDKWNIDSEVFDNLIFTGDIRRLSSIIDINNDNLIHLYKEIQYFKSNGTTTVLCYTDQCDLSWLYIPDENLSCHRIIYTGNFSKNNNSTLRSTCTVEFSGILDEKDIRKQLVKLPGNLDPISFNFEANSYVIQDENTRIKVNNLKKLLKPYNFYLLGRFAEWEYYNMDAAIEASLILVSNNFSK